ncbi:glucuronosyltransferase [Stenotrophomonas maltophilia]|nr:glucuronosyltransferase [Stenotrophomonas maltophilia]
MARCGRSTRGELLGACYMKILVTVGTQFGFNRLIELMDSLAASDNDLKIFAQIGTGTYIPSYMAWERDISPVRFPQVIADSDVIVSHAGMGTIISCRLAGKPLVIVPRQASLGEHRNDHQLATAKRLGSLHGCFTATTADDVIAGIRKSKLSDQEPEFPELEALITGLSNYISGDRA